MTRGGYSYLSVVVVIIIFFLLNAKVSEIQVHINNVTVTYNEIIIKAKHHVVVVISVVTVVF